MSDLPTLHRLAFECLRAGDAGAALGHLSAADRIVPGHPETLLLAADAHGQRGDAASALAVLRELTVRHPSRFDGWFRLGLVADAVGDHGLAAAAYRSATGLRPEQPESWHNLGLALARSGDAAAALAAHAEALRRAPQHPELRRTHAAALRAAGQPDAAVAALESLLVADPRDARAWNLLGIAERERGRAAAARAAYSRALEADGGLADAWYNLGTLELAEGRTEAAAAATRRALALRPDFPAAEMNLAAIELRRGERGAARAAAERAVSLAPRDAATHLQRARILSWSFDRQELADAGESARQALALGAPPAGPHSVLCVVARKLGDLSTAIECGRTAVAAEPAVAEYALHLADALLEAARPDEAAEVLARAPQSGVDAAPVLRQLGIAQVASGAAGPGRVALERAAALDPADQRTTAWRIAACQASGDVHEAARLHDMPRFVRPVRLPVPQGWPDLATFLADFARDIRAHPSLRFEPVGLAAVGGSLAQDLLSARTPCIDAFERALRAAITDYQDALTPDPGHPFLRDIPRRYTLQMWATLLEGSGEIATHIHEESWLSGAYYVSLPEVIAHEDGTRAGWIEFGRPNLAVPGLVPELSYHQPEAGLLLLFPSYLYHRTMPFNEDGATRISISFDLVPERA